MSAGMNRSASTTEKFTSYRFLGGKTPEELEKVFAEIIRELRNVGGSRRYNFRIGITEK